MVNVCNPDKCAFILIGVDCVVVHGQAAKRRRDERPGSPTREGDDPLAPRRCGAPAAGGVPLHLLLPVLVHDTRADARGPPPKPTSLVPTPAPTPALMPCRRSLVDAGADARADARSVPVPTHQVLSISAE